VDQGHARRPARARARQRAGRRVPRPLGRAAMGRHLLRRRAYRPPPGGRPQRPWCQGRRRHRLPAAELDGGRRGLLGVGVPRRHHRADRALLRPQGGRLHPDRRQAEGLHHRQKLRPPGVPARPGERRAHRRRGRPELRRSPEPWPDARHEPRQPGQSRADRLHFRHHAGPQGRHPQPPDARLRDPPARRALPARPGQAAHRGPGRPLHRDAQCPAHPRARRHPDQPRRRLGPGPGTEPHEDRGAVHGRRRDVLRDEPARPSGLHSRPPQAHEVRGPRRRAGPRRGHRKTRQARHHRLPLLRQHRTPVDHRLFLHRAAGQAPLHRRERHDGRGDPAHRRGGDPQPRPRPLPRLHRRDADEQRVRRGRLVSHGRHRRPRRGRVPEHHRPEVRRDHPRRGEHQRPGSRGTPARPGRRTPTVEQVRDHLNQAGLARQKWPEEIHVVDDFPRTASGKVRKYVLRREIAAQQRGE